jgi:DNA-binding response OmpR family regulator
MYKVLICDDEADIRSALNIYLTASGYETVLCGSGQEALEALAQGGVQLVLLDIMMPQMDGITALSRIRETSNVPVILLTAKSEDTDKILGLDVGADDYITKPFNPVEVLARVKSQLRRYLQLGAAISRPTDLVCGPVRMDDLAKTVTMDGEPISLTPTEYDILRLFLTHPGQVFSIAEIYRQVWQESPLGNEGTVAVHIRHLREKLEIDPSNPRHLTVVWGQGYKFVGN